MALFQPVANPIPCFKGVHESMRSVVVSMNTYLHMRVDYAQRDTSVECRTRHPPTLDVEGARDVFITITQRGTTIMVVFPEKRVCIFNACVNDKNRRAQIRMKYELCCFDG